MIAPARDSYWPRDTEKTEFKLARKMASMKPSERQEDEDGDTHSDSDAGDDPCYKSG